MELAANVHKLQARANCQATGNSEIRSPGPMTAAPETVVSLVQSLNTQAAKPVARAECQKGQPNRGSNRSRECWICGKDGHFKADCPNHPELLDKVGRSVEEEEEGEEST